jgi:hypothetical protein
LRSIVSAAQNEEKENTQQRGTNRHKEKRIVGGTLRKWGIAKFHFNSIMWPGTKYIIKGKVHHVARHKIYYKGEGDGFLKPELR